MFSDSKQHDDFERNGDRLFLPDRENLWEVGFYLHERNQQPIPRGESPSSEFLKVNA